MIIGSSVILTSRIIYYYYDYQDNHCTCMSVHYLFNSRVSIIFGSHIFIMRFVAAFTIILDKVFIRIPVL